MDANDPAPVDPNTYTIPFILFIHVNCLSSAKRV